MREDSIRINPETLRIELRKGDSGSTCFRLNEHLDDGLFFFVVKESLSQPDSEAPIYRTFEHPGGPYVLIHIDEEASDRLSSVPSSTNCFCTSYKDYIWGLKYAAYLYDEEGNCIGTDAVRTLIPRIARRPPIFRVYPEVIEGPHL